MKPEPFIFEDMQRLPSLQPEGWSDITSAFEFYLKNNFCYPFKVCIDNDLAGVGTAISFGNTAWLAHIIVHRDFRNRGVGQIITNFLVEFLKQTPCETIFLLATKLGYPVYRKAGFTVESDYIFFKDGKLLVPASQEIVPMQDQYTDAILALDQKISGESRQSILTPHLHGTFVYVRDSIVQGFFIPSLGDGLIVADNSEAGLALMTERNKNHERFILPDRNIEAIEFLKRYHFIEYQRGTRMRLGKSITWHPAKYFNRIGGNMG